VPAYEKGAAERTASLQRFETGPAEKATTFSGASLPPPAIFSGLFVYM